MSPDLQPDPQAAADLRSRAIAHARSLPATGQDFLDLRRATVDPADPYGNNGATWSMSYQEGDKHWINSNMFYSIATILRTDIAIARHLHCYKQEPKFAKYCKYTARAAS
jgi:hypothetical protein